MYGKYVVNVPLLQKSIRKIERKCTENATHWASVRYKAYFKKLEFEIYLHDFLGISHYLRLGLYVSFQLYAERRTLTHFRALDEYLSFMVFLDDALCKTQA